MPFISAFLPILSALGGVTVLRTLLEAILSKFDLRLDRKRLRFHTNEYL